MSSLWFNEQSTYNGIFYNGQLMVYRTVDCLCCTQQRTVYGLLKCRQFIVYLSVGRLWFMVYLTVDSLWFNEEWKVYGFPNSGQFMVYLTVDNFWII